MNINLDQIISTSATYWVLLVIAFLLLINLYRRERHEKGSKK